MFSGSRSIGTLPIEALLIRTVMNSVQDSYLRCRVTKDLDEGCSVVIRTLGDLVCSTVLELVSVCSKGQNLS